MASNKCTKQALAPNRRQKIALSNAGYNWKDYLMLHYESDFYYKAVNKKTGKEIRIDKYVKSLV